MFDHDARSCYQLLLYSLCVALGQQSQIAQNCVVEEVVWTVSLCISQFAGALKMRDERWSWKLCRTMFVHDVRSCFQLLLLLLLLLLLCVELGQQSKMARNSAIEEVVWTVLLCISQSVFAVKARDERSSGKLLVQ